MSELNNEKPILPIGSIVTAKVEFTHVKTGNSITSNRPVLVIRDYGDGAVKIATITSRVEKEHVKENGHQLENYEEYGLNKPSAVLCTRFNMGVLSRDNVSEPIGRIPFSEMKQVLEKAEQLNKIELRYNMKVVSELER